MVGVAGGSKGCSTCRKRKIKCDLQSPVCGQCIRSRRYCSGPNLTTSSHIGQKKRERRPVSPVVQYDNMDLETRRTAARAYKTMEHKFVIMSATPDQLKVDNSEEVAHLHDSPSLTSTSACGCARSSSSSSTSILGTPVDEIIPVLDKYEFEKDEDIALEVDDASKQAIVRSNITRANPALDNAYFQVLLSSFMDYFCPMTSTHFDGAVFDPWISSLPNFISSATPALAYAAKAVVVGHFSRVRPNRDLDLFGTQLYVQALRHQNLEVSQSIERPSLNDDLISAGLLLGLYEIFYCTTIESWGGLIKGCLDLFERRGPHAFKTGLSAVLFQSARTMLTIYVLSGLAPSFLAEPEWITVPFERLPQKPPHQKLNDILLCIPRYQRIIVTFRPRARGREKLSLEQRMTAAAAFFGLVDLRTRLDKWLIDYKRTISGIVSDCLPDSVLYIEDYDKKCDPNATNEQWSSTHLFKPPLIFASNAVANVIPLYYTALAIIQRGLCGAYDCAQEFPCGREEVVNMPLEEFEKLTALRVARYNRLVCQSVEYVLSMRPAVLTLNIVYPLKIAQIFMEDPLEKYWAFKWCEKLDKWFGLAISMIPIEEDGSDNMMIPRLVDLLPNCLHCGEKVRANGQKLIGHSQGPFNWCM
ncbi:hypothetical protein V1517DRAFT_283948 [Lipomyces orientalis]|uniref:Uncharacterized protein n=1 Tax=Lipomyces orientalis TaxID=1233043 RepID=A0ACC3TY24_9ASCO